MTPYDHPLPVSPQGGEPGSSAAPPLHKRSGSQKRQREDAAKIAMTQAEKQEAMRKASACGLTLSSYGRAAMLGAAGPRARRSPTVHAQLLGHAIAQLNRAGNVANQIAHRLNAAQAVGSGESLAAIAEIREAARAIREAVGRKDRDDSQGEQA